MYASYRSFFGPHGFVSVSNLLCNMYSYRVGLLCYHPAATPRPFSLSFKQTLNPRPTSARRKSAYSYELTNACIRLSTHFSLGPEAPSNIPRAVNDQLRRLILQHRESGQIAQCPSPSLKFRPFDESRWQGQQELPVGRDGTNVPVTIVRVMATRKCETCQNSVCRAYHCLIFNRIEGTFCVKAQ